jgi:hypothetical protein
VVCSGKLRHTNHVIETIRIFPILALLLIRIRNFLVSKSVISGIPSVIWLVPALSAMFCTLARVIPVQINDFYQAQELCRLWYPRWLSYLALPCYLTIIAQCNVSALVRAHVRLYVLYFCLNPSLRAREYPLTLSPFMFLLLDTHLFFPLSYVSLSHVNYLHHSHIACSCPCLSSVTPSACPFVFTSSETPRATPI